MTIDNYCSHDVVFEKEKYSKEDKTLCLSCDTIIDAKYYFEKENVYVVVRGQGIVTDNARRVYTRNPISRPEKRPGDDDILTMDAEYCG